jgi:hypothetical protein
LSNDSQKKKKNLEMNIFIKYNEQKKEIPIKESNITILELIDLIKDKITPKDEIKNYDLKLTFQKSELAHEKKLNEYNIQNNDVIEAHLIAKNIFFTKRNIYLNDIEIILKKNKNKKKIK